MKKNILVLALIFISSLGVFGQKIRTTAVFDADTATRPKAGFYGIGVRGNVPFLVKNTGNTIRFGMVSSFGTNYIPKFNSSGGLANSSIFDDGGNVGIGTASPLSALDVRGINGGIPSLSSSPTGTLLIGSNETSAALSIGVNGGSYAYLQYRGRTGDGGSYPLVLNPLGGNVGIGTASPMDLLDVTKNTVGGIGGRIVITNSASQSADNVASLGFKMNNNFTSGYYSAQIQNINSSENNGRLGFLLYDGLGDVGGNEKFSILSSGNVGIGTVSPTSKLQVVGLPVYADNAAATSGGLTSGAFYRTSTGVLMVVY